MSCRRGSKTTFSSRERPGVRVDSFSNTSSPAAAILFPLEDCRDQLGGARHFTPGAVKKNGLSLCLLQYCFSHFRHYPGNQDLLRRMASSQNDTFTLRRQGGKTRDLAGAHTRSAFSVSLQKKCMFSGAGWRQIAVCGFAFVFGPTRAIKPRSPIFISK